MSTESLIVTVCVVAVIILFATVALFGVYEYSARRSARRDRQELASQREEAAVLRDELAHVRAERDKLSEKLEHQVDTFERGLELGYQQGIGAATRNSMRMANRRAS